MTATVIALEYDPNRSARIALLEYADGERRYILAPLGLKVGTVVESGPGADIKVGNALPLSAIPLGTTVHAIELNEGRGAQMCRSAGTSAQVMAKEGKSVTLRCPPAKCAWCSAVAARPSVRWAISIMRISASAKPGACAIWAAAGMCAAW